MWLVLGVIWKGLGAFVDVFGSALALLKWVWDDFGLGLGLVAPGRSRLRELLLRRSHCLRRL